MVGAVLVELDLAAREEIAAWRAEQTPGADALAALEAGALVLADVYVEARIGPAEDDVTGLTLAGVELLRTPGPEPSIDDAVIGAALEECAAQLAEDHGIETGVDALRDVLNVRVSAGLLAALREGP